MPRRFASRATSPGASTALEPFLPRSILGLVQEALRGGASWRRAEGTVLFCDVAGFTPLTEALASIGREGAEELTRVLNGYFEATVGVLLAAGGDVLRFGGDAVTVAFPGRSPVPACDAALRVMASMRAFRAIETRAGTFALDMKAGIAHGAIQVGLVGGRDAGWEYYAAGPAVDGAAVAEHHALPGRVVLHGSVERGRRLGCTDAGGGFSFLEEVRGGAVATPPPPERAVPDPDALRLVLPRHLQELAASRAPGEHRGTAVVFASLAGLREDPRGLHADVARAFRALAATASAYGGIVNKVDMGDKGAKAILLFGAPRALERREEMAVRAAMELMTHPDLAELHLRVGLSSAPLFSGPVGSAGRREFTVMGDGINVAARLMQAAPVGSILCTEACASAVPGLRFDALAPIQVKGKRDPLAVFSPTAEVVESAGSAVIVERDGILQDLSRYLEEGGPIPALVAPAGHGKTAVLGSLVRAAAAAGRPVTRVTLAPYHAERFLAAWQGAVHDVLGLGAGAGAERAREARERALADEKPGYRPLLNPLLGLPPEQTAALRHLEPQKRRDLAVALVVRLLSRIGRRLVAVDGIQWADPASLQVLAQLAEDADGAGWRMAVAFRPEERLEGIAPSLRVVPVPPLTAGGVDLLLRRGHGLTDVPAAVGQWFAERSRGVPAVVNALMGAVDDAGLLLRDRDGSRVDDDRLSRTAFPETLEGLYLARAESLPPGRREVLGAASILGGSVSETLLAHVAGQGADIAGDLDALCGAGLLVRDTWHERPYVKFADTLMRDAVYHALPFARRRDGHRRAAELLELEDRETPRVWPALAHHFEQAGDMEKARSFARLAGRDAAARFDNLAAMRHLEVACRGMKGGPEEIEDAMLLMDSYGHLGRWIEARPVLQGLKELEAGAGTAHRARLASYESRDLASRQDWTGVEDALHRSLALAREAGDPELVARAHVNLAGRLYGPKGNLPAAREALLAALALPEDGRRPWKAVARMNLGVVLLLRGDPGAAAETLGQAYREARGRRLGPLMGTIAAHLGSIHLELGHVPAALRLLRESLQIVETFSERGSIAHAQINLAQALLVGGRVGDASDLLRSAIRRAAMQGDATFEAIGRRYLADASALDGDVEGALGETAGALGRFRQLGNVRDAALCLGLTWLFHALGAREEAVRAWRDWDADPLVTSAEADPALAPALERLTCWVRGEEPWRVEPAAFLAGASGASAEERLERLLWVCEAASGDGDVGRVREHLGALHGALSAWPSHVGHVRRLRLRLSLPEAAAGAGREAASLLVRGPAGAWGVRLLCGLAARDPRAAGVRRRAAALLASWRERGPDWAWRRLAALPEVGDYLSRHSDVAR